MPNLADLLANLLSLADALYDLRYSPRPVDKDWRRHKDTLDDERNHRDRSVAALKECMTVLDQVRSALPSDWLGSDPKASKYIQLKSALRTMLNWLSDFQRPFRGYKMPLLGDDPEQIRKWDDAERAMLSIARDLRDEVDLQVVNASRAAPDRVPVERIRHLPISDEAKEVFVAATKFVLDNPKRFGAAAARLGTEVYPGGPLPAGQVDRAAYILRQIFQDYAAADIRTLLGSDYDLWAHSMLLLAVLVSYAGDLAAFGPCGAIPWHNSSESIQMTTPATAHESAADLAGGPEDLDADEFSIPLPGREWALLDLRGKLWDELQDPEPVAGGPNIERGILGQFVDKSKVVMRELGIAYNPVAAPSTEAQRPSTAVPGHRTEDLYVSKESVTETQKNEKLDDGVEHPIWLSDSAKACLEKLLPGEKRTAEDLADSGPGRTGYPIDTVKPELAELARTGLVRSKRGPGGGYVITDAGRRALEKSP